MSKQEARKARLAAALRANLKRRKDPAKAAPDEAQPDAPDGAPDAISISTRTNLPARES